MLAKINIIFLSQDSVDMNVRSQYLKIKFHPPLAQFNELRPELIIIT